MNNKTPKSLAQVEEQQVSLVPVNNEATALIAQAIDKNVPVETMEKLLAMRRELKQEAAKEAYDRAMATFQSECPTIQKTKEVKNQNNTVIYKYAPIESIVDQVREALKNNGFSYSTSMDLLENGVKVCIKVTHAQGHSEETCMTVPLGTKTQVMSASQQVAAATTFAKRYAFCNALGILTGDEDNDGATIQATSPSPRPSMQQAHQQTILPITTDQKGDLMILLGKLGKTQSDLNKVVLLKYKKGSYQLLTKNEADSLILYMRNSLETKTVGKLESPDMTEEEVDEIAQGIEQQKLGE